MNFRIKFVFQINFCMSIIFSFYKSICQICPGTSKYNSLLWHFAFLLTELLLPIQTFTIISFILWFRSCFLSLVVSCHSFLYFVFWDLQLHNFGWIRGCVFCNALLQNLILDNLLNMVSLGPQASHGLHTIQSTLLSSLKLKLSSLKFNSFDPITAAPPP